jgi:6-O-methylguanine DNA methyltransferase, DNA binding domain
MKKPAKNKKSWGEKLAENKGLPKTARIEGKLSKRWGSGTMVIPAPLDVDAAMKQIRRGKLTTISAICQSLAKKHRTTMACPITTGIFAWIAAHAADEAETAGRKRITPYWRTLKAGGELNPKYPGGIKNLRSRLEAEGHRVIAKGKRYFVADFCPTAAGVKSK